MTSAKSSGVDAQLLVTKLHAPRRRREVVRRPRPTDISVPCSPSGPHAGLGAGWLRQDHTADRVVQHDRRPMAHRHGWRSMRATTTRPCSARTSSLRFGARAACSVRHAESLLRASQPLQSAVATLVNDLDAAGRRRRPRARRLTTSSSPTTCTSDRVPRGPRATMVPSRVGELGPIRPCRWHAGEHAATCSRSVPPTCDSRPTKPRATSTKRWAWICRPRSVSALEARTEGWIAALHSPRCHCGPRRHRRLHRELHWRRPLRRRLPRRGGPRTSDRELSAPSCSRPRCSIG